MVVARVRPRRDAVPVADPLKEPLQALAIVVAGLVAGRVRPPVPPGQLWEVLIDERQVALPRTRLEAERARTDVRRTRFGDALHERLEGAWIVGDAREN